MYTREGEYVQWKYAHYRFLRTCTAAGKMRRNRRGFAGGATRRRPCDWLQSVDGHRGDAPSLLFVKRAGDVRRLEVDDLLFASPGVGEV